MLKDELVRAEERGEEERDLRRLQRVAQNKAIAEWDRAWRRRMMLLNACISAGEIRQTGLPFKRSTN